MTIITLTTDFGTRDGYVGAVKGVLAREAPDARVIDIAHDIPPGDVAHAAWVVKSAARQFPEQTIHVVVVDPGVGSSRRGVVIIRDEQAYVGPDNGVFAYVASPGTPAYGIDGSWLAPRTVSSTFHGRDVFAPAAAWLASHGPLQQRAIDVRSTALGSAIDVRSTALGSAIDVRSTALGSQIILTGALPWGPRPAGEGRIVHIDGYGNLISDLPADEAGSAIVIAGQRLAIVETYASVASDQLLAYIGSEGTVEVAVRDGRAAARLQVARGERLAPVVAGGGSHR